jgi:hypothetical protein
MYRSTRAARARAPRRAVGASSGRRVRTIDRRTTAASSQSSRRTVTVKKPTKRFEALVRQVLDHTETNAQSTVNQFSNGSLDFSGVGQVNAAPSAFDFYRRIRLMPLAVLPTLPMGAVNTEKSYRISTSRITCEIAVHSPWGSRTGDSATNGLAWLRCQSQPLRVRWAVVKVRPDWLDTDPTWSSLGPLTVFGLPGAAIGNIVTSTYDSSFF